ncbi:MAG: hypothetical protein M3Q69_08310 [Acidobacteriota bacterium]|nr:hypothetical protein [Acidobacteriota bacterium]
MPLTRKQAYTACEWMKGNFGTRIQTAVRGTPFSVDLLCGIACQETAIFWLSFLKRLSPNEIVERCVFDASGDYPDTQRSAFPRNTAAFRKRYGDEFADMLIAEANATRRLRGFGPAQWVYKGYGLYQYDLQHVGIDEAFFREKQWYSFDICLDRAIRELNEKYKIHHDIWKTVRAYNGTGSRATEYANNVVQFTAYSSEVG